MNYTDYPDSLVKFLNEIGDKGYDIKEVIVNDNVKQFILIDKNIPSMDYIVEYTKHEKDFNIVYLFSETNKALSEFYNENTQKEI